MAAQCTCPLCGYSFDPEAHLACQTCPLHSGCRLVCCPSCGYTTVDSGQSRLVRWVLGRMGRGAQPADSAPATPGEPGRARQCAVTDVPVGQRARVVDLSALPVMQREQLQGYGVLPGSVLRVVQHAPATVVQIEHTELAIEPDLARAIVVHTP